MICKKICENLGGSIEVESEDGKGTMFSCYIGLEYEEQNEEDYNTLESAGFNSIKIRDFEFTKSPFDLYHKRKPRLAAPR
jgi:hypothetical protein